MGRVAIALFAVLLIAGTPRAESWRTYANERFGSTAEVPTDWHAGEPPENGDGLVFTSPDEQATITVYGSLHIWDSIGEAMEIYLQPSQGETITYRHRERRAVVVSGQHGDRIFYRKSILSCRDNVWNNVSIEYPAARKAEFDALVTRVAQSLRPGRSAQVKQCNR